MATRSIAGSVLAAGLVVGLLAGCGTSKSGSSTTSGSTSLAAASGGHSSAIAAANRAYASFVDPDPNVTIPALGKPAPTGKTMDIMSCPVPICSVYANGAEQAAKVLGWKYKVLVFQFSPTSFESTWNQIDQDKPNAVFIAESLPLAVVAKQVVAAKANGSVLVAYGVGQTVGPQGSTAAARDISINVVGPLAFAMLGRVQALEAIHDAQGPANVLILSDPTLGAATASQVAADKSTVEGAGGTATVMEVSSSNIGTSLPGTVVTYLRSHPSVKYVALPTDDYLPGLPQALSSAGLAGKVKLIGSAANATSQKLIDDGQVFASTAHPTQANAWAMINGAVRALVGDPIADPNPPGAVSVLEKGTSAAVGSAVAWPSSVYAKYRAAWGLK